jgi:glycosyltransferase involved in cell wall biosynthesis
MAANHAAPHGFAYLFERFPSFTQTFCAREVGALRASGLEFPVFSIRQPSGEPAQDCLDRDIPVTRLPDRFDHLLADDTWFRRAVRRGQDQLRARWGGDNQKRRIYEAQWLGPRLQALGVRHVHVHFAGVAARTAYWLHEMFGVEYSITAHANDIFCDEPAERLAMIFGAARLVVTVSDFSLGYLRDHFPEAAPRCRRVYNGIRLDRFTPTDGGGEPPLILSVGRYIEKKGFEVLIDACAQLGRRDWECQIVGQGPLHRALEERIAAHGLADRITVTGPRSESEIRALLARSRVFALPCVTSADGGMDNLPTVIMEAMAAAVPVVSTPLAAIPEMVREGETGFLVPERDPAALAARLAEFLDDRSLALRCGRAGLARCRELFALEETSAHLHQTFREFDAVREA